MRNISFDLQLLSKYRAELMGFATILIILCHAIPNGVHLPHVIEKVMEFGQTGVELFLFLSGIGMYYSLALPKKKVNLGTWCYKRVSRLMLPYWIIYAPYFCVYSYLIGKISLLSCVDKFTTIGFWFGDSCVWFIAAIIPMYLLSPLMLCIMNQKFINIKVGGAILALFVIQILHKRGVFCNTAAMQHIMQAVTVAPSFVLGFYMSPFIAEKKILAAKQVVMIVIAVVALWVALYILLKVKSYWLFMLLFAALLCKLLDHCHRFIPAVLAFLGAISLESYLFNTSLPAWFRGSGNVYYQLIVIFGISGAWVVNKFVSKIR